MLERYVVQIENELRELHKKGEEYFTGKEQCEHCAEQCHSHSGLGCDEPDAPWPCATIQILDRILKENRPD